jgi:TolA-binding protein
MIFITPDEYKFEDEIVFAKILDGKPDNSAINVEKTPIHRPKEGSKHDASSESAAGQAERLVVEERTQTMRPVKVPTPEKETDGSQIPPRNPSFVRPPVKPIHTEETSRSIDIEIRMEAEYRKALRNSSIYERQGDHQAAAQELSTFIERYPKSELAEKAKQKKAELLSKGGSTSGQ